MLLPGRQNMDGIVKSVPGWETEILGFNQGTLAVLLGLVVLVGVARTVAMVVIPRIFSTLCEKSPIADLAIRGSSKALGTAAGAAVLWQVSMALIAGELDQMPGIVETWLPSLAKLVMLVAIMAWALRLTAIIQSLVEYWDDDEELDGSERTLISAMESVMRFVIVIFGSISIADALHFDLTTMVAGLGITGLALALAAKDSIANVFGAVTVLLDRPFRVGDWVVVGNVEGEVIQISLRTTMLRTGVDTVVTLPNATLTSKPIDNFGKRRWRRYKPVLSVDLDSDPNSVEAFTNEVAQLIQDHDKTMKKESSYAMVSAIAKDSIEIGCNLYWDVSGAMEEGTARQAWLLDVARTAKKHGIEFYEPRVRRN